MRLKRAGESFSILDSTEPSARGVVACARRRRLFAATLPTCIRLFVVGICFSDPLRISLISVFLVFFVFVASFSLLSHPSDSLGVLVCWAFFAFFVVAAFLFPLLPFVSSFPLCPC